MNTHLHHSYDDADSRLRFVVSPSAGADAWSNAGGQAATKYQAGVNGFTGDWAGATKSQQGVMLSNINQAVTSGRWAAGIDRVGTAGWKSRTVAKVGNYTNGYTSGKDAYLAAAQKLYPYIAQGQQQVKQMPKGSLADAKARASFWIDYMAAGKGSF